MRKTTILICLLFFFLSCSAISIALKRNPVKLAEFEGKEGIFFEERIRMKVTDIVIGKVSVKSLFKSIEQKEATWWEYYSGKKHRLSLIINNSSDLEKLRLILIEQNTDQLKIILQDDQNTLLRYIFKDRFNTDVVIFIESTPCEEITRIIYTSINSLIKEKIQKEGETDKHIDLNQVFDILLHDKIEPYMASLSTVKRNNPCFNTFELLKWIQGGEISGYNSGDYYINEGLRGLLQSVIGALLDNRSNWKQSNFSVKAIGYTDSVLVRSEKIDIRMDKTGIDDWSKIKKPLNIWYGGCDNDKLDNHVPVYINFTSEGEKQIKQNKISNNCELGAVRAYIAMIYSINKLGLDGIEYSYATGGIYSNSDNKRNDPQKRKINVEFTIKAANTDK